MLIYNGKIMRRFLVKNSMTANSFFIDEGTKTIYLKLAQPMQTNDLIEIPNQMFLFRCTAKNNVALKKIIFEHENSYIQSGLNDGDGWGVAVGFRSNTRTRMHDILIEDCVFRQCNSTAFKFDSYDNVTMRRCIAKENGWKGIGFGNCTNVLQYLGLKFSPRQSRLSDDGL